MTELEAAGRLAIAALIGLAVGIEREWSVQIAGRPARFAGLRTFGLLGILGGCAGLVLALGYGLAASALLLGGAALVVAAYLESSRLARTEPDGTTEVAALLVVALGALAGLDLGALAAGAAAVVVVLLGEKQTLHGAVRHIGEVELRAALRFGLLALVILPVLPEGPVLGPLDLHPRSLWSVVLIFSAINFAGFVARRAAGDRTGVQAVGLLGGLISSTAVTLDFSRRSIREPGIAGVLALGVVGACTVLIPRVLIVCAALNPAVALALLPILLPGLAVGGLALLRGVRKDATGEEAPAAPPGNPLRFWMAVRMALAFQVALVAIAFVRARWPLSGLYGTAALLGLTDMDALTVGMSRPTEPLAAPLAARAIAIGMMANTAFKAGISATLGGPGFRRPALAGLAALGSAIGLGLALFG